MYIPSSRGSQLPPTSSVFAPLFSNNMTEFTIWMVPFINMLNAAQGISTIHEYKSLSILPCSLLVNRSYVARGNATNEKSFDTLVPEFSSEHFESEAILEYT